MLIKNKLGVKYIGVFGNITKKIVEDIQNIQ